jgi:hypothetical protein
LILTGLAWYCVSQNLGAQEQTRFDEAYSGKLFGAFQRLHGADELEGTGIGTATVQRVVRRYGEGSGPRARWTATLPSRSLSKRE